jgi:CRP-like cAMP-binding protein
MTSCPPKTTLRGLFIGETDAPAVAPERNADRFLTTIDTDQRPMAHARTTDPSTSHEAARDAERRGVAAAQRLLCLAQVTRHPGQTAAEVAEGTGLERHAPSRRLPELRDAGLVVNGPIRICTVKGRRSLTWIPTQEAQP